MAEELTRLQKAILFVLYESDPIPLSENEIGKAIERKGLMQMSDDEFQHYGKNMVIEHQMKEKGLLN